MSANHLNIFRRFKRATSVYGQDEQEQVEIFDGGLLSFFGPGTKGDILPMHTALTAFTLIPPVGAAAAGKDPITTIAGTGTVPAPTRAAKGGVNIATRTTSAAQNDQAYITGPASSGFIAPIKAASRIVFSTRIMIPTITTAAFSAGLNENPTNVLPSATAGEGAMFLYDSEDADSHGEDGANWILAHKVNGVDTYTDTGIVVQADVDYDLRIEIGTDLKARFYLDGVLVGTGPALTSGDSVTAFAGVHTEATSTIPRSFDCRYLRLSRLIG